MRLAAPALALLLSAASALAQQPGQGQAGPPPKAPPPAGPPARPAGAEEPRLAVAVLAPAAGSSARGVVRLVVGPAGLRVTAEATGLPPSAAHGLHVRVLGDLSAPDASSAGRFYPPEWRGGPGTGPGALGALQADARGAARLEVTVDPGPLGGLRALLGRALVLHASGPPGGPGPALAAGVIGLAADGTPPVVTVLAPKEGARLNRNPVNVVVQVTDDTGVAAVTIGGQPAQPDPAAPGRWKAALTIPNGAQRVAVSARDAAGNEGSAAVTFAFNDRPPQVQASAAILVEGRVDDLTCTLTVNGQKVEYDKATGAWTARVPADPQDPRRVTVVATDEYGNARTEVRQLQ